MLLNYLPHKLLRLIHQPSACRSSRLSSLSKPSSGFTLIELLVALLIGSIIVTVLLSFMNSILQTDRQEQAKANTEQEIQAAIDYITEDLRESIYIYDADGLYRDHNATASASGIQNQIPPIAGVDGCSSTDTATSCTPILVFWKRQLRTSVVPVPDAPTPTICSGSTAVGCNDTFVYSLVGYYLITVRNPGGDTNWSGRARIARFAIQDGVKNPLVPTISPLPATPRTNPRNFNYQDSTKAAGMTNNIPNCFGGSSDPNCPSPGFQLFDPKPAPNIQLKDALNQWQKDSNAFTIPLVTLLDHVDHTVIDPLPSASVNNVVRCGSVSANAQQIPASGSGTPGTPLQNVPGFFACVDSVNGLVQVEIRGNARTRLYGRTRLDQIGFTTVVNPDVVTGKGWVGGQLIRNRITFFPSARTQVVRANSFLNNQ